MSLASLSPIPEITKEQVMQGLEKLKWEDGNRVFDSSEALNKGVNNILNRPFISYKNIDFSKLRRNAEVITDSNMITEYKYGFFNQ